jgi:hypothetical protein
MKRILPTTALAATLLIPAASTAEDAIDIQRPSFALFHEFGYITKGTDMENRTFENYVLQRSGVWMNMKAVRNERLTLHAVIGGIYWNPTFNENSSSESSLRYFAAAAPRASATYVFGDVSEPSFTIEAGMFPYKYNEHSRNLGEYMFRTTAYPTQVFNGGLTWVEANRAQITGVRLGQPLGGMFSHEALVTVETDQLPYYDMNLTYLAKAKIGQALKMGAGVQFARLLPVRPSVTNPDIARNRYFTFNDTTYIDNGDYYAQRLSAHRLKGKDSQDSLMYLRGQDLATRLTSLIDNGMSMNAALDSLERAEAVSTGSSSYGHYDGSSIKTVLSFSFDPKAFLGDMGVLAPNEMVLYGEAAILGLKDYPILYEDRMERTVAMVGFNFPTFRQLDVLALELEWFGSRAPNSSAYSQQSISKISDGSIPQPRPQPSIYSENLSENGYAPEDWEKDNLRWSVFARRHLVKGLSLDLQAASDNSRGWVFPSGRRYWAYFRSPSDWYWMFKLTASI